MNATRVTPQPEAQKPTPAIDTAIADCAATIRRHLWQPISEVFVALALLSIAAYALVALAKLQGADNDGKRQTIQATIESRTRDLTPLRATRTNAEAIVRELSDSAAFRGLRERVKQLAEVKPPSPATLNALGQLQAQLSSNEQRLALAQAQAKEMEGRIADTQAELGIAQKELAGFQGKPLVSDGMLVSNGTFFILVVAVLAGIYRYHLREAARLQQHKLALLRIRIAANNYDTPGFDGEVRTSLTRGAFDIPSADASPGLLARRAESPVPGHPGADLAAALVNRLLDQADLILKPKTASGKGSEPTKGE